MALQQVGMLDIVVFAFTILVSIVVGLYHAFRRRNSTMEYFLAGRKMAVLPVVLSYVVTFESSILVMGYPAEVYIHGFTFWFYNIGFVLAMLITSRITPKLFHPLGLKSVFEYLSLRFGNRKVRLLATSLTILSYAFYMGVVMSGPAIALQTLSSIPEWGTILILALAAGLYSTLGGLKAVIWTDVFQFIVIVVGIIAVLIKGTLDAGGLKNVFELNRLSGRLDIEFNPNPFIRHSVWSLAIGTTGRVIAAAFSAVSVQRSNSTRTVQDGEKVFRLSIIGFVLLQTMVMVEGLVAFAYFSSQGCDPLRSNQITNPNGIVPFLVVKLFGSVPGLTGLFLATLVSATLSTVSSLLNSMSVIATEDLVKPSLPNITDQALTRVAKAAVAISGMLGVAVAFMAIHAKGPLSQIFVSIMGGIEGPVVGMFILAVFCAWTTTEGALFGGVAGIVFSVWLSLGYNTSPTRLVTPWLPLGPVDTCPAVNSTWLEHHNASTGFTASTEPAAGNHTRPLTAGVDWLYSISYQYFGLMAVLITVGIGLCMSTVTRKLLKRYSRDENIDPNYLLSFKERFLCCLPAGCTKSPYGEVSQPKTGDVIEMPIL